MKKLVQRLEKQPELYDKYEEIIKEQEKEGIIERTPEKSTAKEFYLPHRAVVKQSEESSKIRIVFDASAKADDKSPSLNHCLETGPSLQNLIWNTLVRNRMQAVMLSGDLKQAFLQIRIREQDRDVLRFHWPKDRDLQKLEIYRFTRAIWGLNQSPFLLEGTIEKHFDDCKEEFSKEVEEIKRRKHVDDVFLGGETTEEVQHLKQTSVEIFSRASFKLHKWHSNRKELVKEELDDSESEESFTKQQLKSKESGTKLLGLGWNESEDTIFISFEKKDSEPTKRGVLQTLASIYDPLGIVSPVTLMGKIIFRDICDQHLKWDSELPENLRERWRRFVKNLPDKIEVPHIISKEGEIQGIDLHAFGDASGNGVSRAIYTTVTQDSGTSQGLLTAKARLAKKGLTTPRLKLVAAHMTANVVDNVKTILKGYPVKKVYGWLDSSVALYWIKGENQYKHFVTNQVSKIKEKEFNEWRHVPSELNPSDIGSRGCYSKKLVGFRHLMSGHQKLCFNQVISRKPRLNQ